ncbi:hypothetical protein V8C86DRAFT_3093290 [Haematococcus lacustris]
MPHPCQLPIEVSSQQPLRGRLVLPNSHQPLRDQAKGEGGKGVAEMTGAKVEKLVALIEEAKQAAPKA